MTPFNFTIHYRPGVKIGHDFILRMDMFLFKDSISALTSTLRAQKQSELLSSRQTNISKITPFDLTQNSNNKRQKVNPMTLSQKIEYIRRKKTHNRHYC